LIGSSPRPDRASSITPGSPADHADHPRQTSSQQRSASSSLAQTRIGGALLLKQDYGLAIESFRQAILLDGANADAFVGMAMAYLHGGDYALARAALEEAKRIDPAKQAKVDEVIAYINQREAGGGAH